MAADRHLVFGLLALQTGLIDHTALMAAFHAWTRDKHRPLADHPVALGYLDAAHRPLLEGLAAAHLARHDGDVEKSLAAVPAGRSTREVLAHWDRRGGNDLPCFPEARGFARLVPSVPLAVSLCDLLEPNRRSDETGQYAHGHRAPAAHPDLDGDCLGDRDQSRDRLAFAPADDQDF
jgi:hypothetical protein